MANSLYSSKIDTETKPYPSYAGMGAGGKTVVVSPCNVSYPALIPKVKNPVHRKNRWELYRAGCWSMVGSRSTETKYTCGNFSHYKCRDSCADLSGREAVKHEMSRCHDPLCPTCFMAWAMKEAIRASIRLSVRAPKYGYRHIIFSPPQDREYTTRELQAVIKALNKECVNSRILGGVTVYHPWRGKDLYGWVDGKHFHVVADAQIDKSEIKAFYEAHKWVVKDKGERKSLLGTLYYELKHAGYVKGRHAVTWFGCYGYRAKLPVPLYKTERACKICGKELAEVELAFEAEHAYSYFEHLTPRQLEWRGLTFVKSGLYKRGDPPEKEIEPYDPYV